MRRPHYALAGAVLLSACTTTTLSVSHPVVSAAPELSRCVARDSAVDIDWRVSDRADAAELGRWCRAVGSPVHANRLSSAAPPRSLDQLVVVSWNAHLADGELPALVSALRGGALTDGVPVNHFVLLIQELYRRGVAVPEFDARDRTAFAIKPRDPESMDVDDHAASLGLSLLYVPSMRNGAELREDRGNAIVSTEPLLDPVAFELPLARQRRVALAAAIAVNTPNGVRRLEVVNAHLEPLSSPKTLWVFKDPRPMQVRALLGLLDEPRFSTALTAGVVLGGDFNTVRTGDAEEAYRLARRWSSSLGQEDRRNTHLMGRLDYLFFRAADGWVAKTRRLDDRFGSDHYPVLATFSRQPAGPLAREPAGL